MTIVTLTTDFGWRDGNVGVMKGVIWGIAPQVHIADLSHGVAPQDIRQAALILGRSAVYFPEGTVHVVVVDPGVGTSRRALAAELGPQRFVGPDNGVITALWDEAFRRGWGVRFVRLDQPRYWLSEVSDVFHGRDVFAPAAAHLASGVRLEDLGSPIGDPVRIDLPEPIPTPLGYRGQVVHIDHFGNIATNLHREHLKGVTKARVRVAGVEVPGLYRTFGELEPGSLMALFGSTGRLIISEVNGNAAERLGVRLDDRVEVFIESPEAGGSADGEQETFT